MTDMNGAADPAYPLAASGRICSSIWGGRRSRSHDRAYDHRKPSGGPPLVDRAVLLPEFADMGAAETPLSARFAPGLRSRSHDRAYDHRKPSGGPPRVDRAVLLPEFADMGAEETP
jgi:hypothetical protein